MSQFDPQMECEVGGLVPETDSPLLAYYGHHKCGTTWIRAVMREVCKTANLVVSEHHYEHCFDGDIVSYRRRHGFDFWSYSNADYAFVRPLNTIAFHVVRDPRDVIVSGYFSHLNTHPDEIWPRLRFYRPYLQSLPKEEGLMKEIEFSGVFLQHMLAWDYGAKPSILELKFEDIIARPLEILANVLEHLGLMPAKIAREPLAALLEHYSFKNLSGGRSPGQEDLSHHYRRGVPGDWRNHFTDKHIAYFKSLYNPLLFKLGYEDREDWSQLRAPASAQFVLNAGQSPQGGKEAEVRTRVVVDQNHEQGIRLFQAGHVNESVEFFEKALKQRETSDGWNDWATALQLGGRSIEAERGYRRALELNPSNSQAAANLGVVLVQSNRPAEALSFLTCSLKGIDGGQRPALEALIRHCTTTSTVEVPTESRRTTSLYPGFEIGDDDTLLDVGCGRGDACVKAGSIGAAVIAIDVLEPTLQYVEKRMAAVPARSFRGYVSDCMPAPLPDETATVVVAQEVLEHTESPEAFLRELVRLGALGARYLISVPDPTSENLLRIIAPPEYFAPPNHRNVFTRDEMERMLCRSGLRIVSRGAVGFYWSIWWLLEMADRQASARKARITGGTTGGVFTSLQSSASNAAKKWEEAWSAVQACPESERITKALDQICPKSAVFICQKV